MSRPSLFAALPVVIKGAGDLGTGVAVRLARAGFPVIVTELAHPLTVRRAVALAQAVFDGETTVEGVTARRCTPAQVPSILAAGDVALLVAPDAAEIAAMRPAAVVDAIMAKMNTGTTRADAPLVIGLGPGFTAGDDCHAVIETNRGHHLGRVIWQGGTEADTGKPGDLPGLPPTISRVLRAPVAGRVTPHFAIGARIAAGAVIATVTGPDGDGPVIAPFDGVLRGLVHPSVEVPAGLKIGDLDPRARPEYCFTVSDKSLAIGGGVLETILDACRQGRLSLSTTR